tara:strand:- start:191 stop:442 length:252 start_codon:yes stop_codon:yes gene_type:complete
MANEELKPPEWKPATKVAKVYSKKRSKVAKKKARKLKGPHPTRPKEMLKGSGLPPGFPIKHLSARKHGMSHWFDSEGKFKDDY